MPLKSWILDKLNRMDGLLGRPDLPRRDAVPATTAAASSNGAPAVVAPLPVEHLGPYSPLIEAIRDELQRFVDGPLRLHLAIAERDRFLLTAIEIGCDDDEALELLRRFIAEFKPDQIRRFLTREVVSGLPNANTFELAQFGGLRAALPAEAEAASEATDEYAELLAELRQTTPAADPRAYRLTLIGRWVEREGGASAAAVGTAAAGGGADEPALQTPLAGHRLDVDVEDAAGRRRVVLAAVVAGRRYSIGKGEGCDIVADGTYSSRRHAEFWFDEGSWWLLDTGSTNGIRVEVGGDVVARSPATPAASGTAAASEAPIALAPGARIVLSALAEGAAADYPTLALQLPDQHATAGPTAAAAPTTPMTPIVPRPRTRHALMLTARMASGQRAAVIDAESMPFGVGRSRSQALAVDLVHASVSGQHLEITGCDGSGADVVVHGDNGVVVDGRPYPAGARLRWPVGSTMVLGHPVAGEPACTLLLTGRP